MILSKRAWQTSQALSTKGSIMPRYVFDKWEHNGRDDSDWYAVVYTSETDKLERIETGTTRFANAHPGTVEATLLEPTEEVKARVVVILTGMYLHALTNLEHKRVYEPEPSELEGKRVRLVQAVKNQKKTSIPCPKCSGSGKWTNPHNSMDQRPCFACKGTGSTRGEKMKGPDGKPVWEVYPEGTEGVVTGTAFYGKTYRNGYNTVNRSNTTAYVRLDDGREVRVACDKVRLAEEPVDQTALAAARAKTLSVYPFFRTAGFRL